MTNVEGARKSENLVGNTAQQREVSKLPVRSGGIVRSSDNTGNLDSSHDGSEAVWEKGKALQIRWNAIRENEPDPVDYELEELDKLGI